MCCNIQTKNIVNSPVSHLALFHVFFQYLFFLYMTYELMLTGFLVRLKNDITHRYMYTPVWPVNNLPPLCPTPFSFFILSHVFALLLLGSSPSVWPATSTYDDVYPKLRAADFSITEWISTSKSYP